MYIEIHNWQEFEQKVLYFKLNNAFNIDINNDLNLKIAGIYAIYSDNRCLYVGQSKNLASRIATHLRGKYKRCSNIYAWDIEDIITQDFSSLVKEIQEQILIRTEKYFMSILKPIDNLDIDMDYKDAWLPNVCFESSSTFTIQISDDLFITDNYPHNIENIALSIESIKKFKEIDNNRLDAISDMLNDEAMHFFYNRGVKNED